MNRSKIIGVRLTPDEHKLLKVAAKRRKRKLSDYVRLATFEAIDRIDSEHEVQAALMGRRLR